MSLEVSKLENVRVRGGKTIGRCPACAEAGHDQKGEHLVINANGSFGCFVYPGDSAEAQEHRKRIFALCRDREIKQLSVHPADLGRLGRPNQNHLADQPLKTGLLGRLGRVFQTHLETERTDAGNEDRMTEKLNDFGRGVPGVPGVLSTPAMKAHKPQLLALLELPFCMVYSELLQETIFFCEEEDTKEALVKAGAEPWSVYTREEVSILLAQNRIAPLSQAELRKLHEIKQTFGARITQNNLKS
jgi:hypothetical protein